MRPGRSYHRLAGLLVAALVPAAGCGNITFEYNYDSGVRAGQQKNQIALVYFDSWQSSECAQFRRDVIDNPKAKPLFEGLVPVLLFWEFNHDRAQALRVRRVPALVAVMPSGNTLPPKYGPMTLDEFADYVNELKALHAPTTAPSPE